MDKKLSVCLLNDSFPPFIDGVANTVVNYANIIEKNYGSSLVLTPNVHGADDSGFPFKVVRYPSIDMRKFVGYVAGYPFSPESANAVRAANVDIIHSHCPVSSTLLARELAASMQLPLVMTWHTKFDIDIAKAVKNKLLQEGAKMALLRNVNACDEIWTVSKGAGENLKSIGYEGDYIVMPNGVDLPHELLDEDFVISVTKDYDLPEDVPCFLFVGRMMWYKGVRIIFDALAELKNACTDFRMVMIGDGLDLPEMKAYSEELGLSDKLIFTGAISGRELLRAWYQRADVFLFPSTYDTNGLVVREAAASDTAAVIIDGSCAAEGIIDGRNGFLIEENAASLAAKLKELAADPTIMKKVGITAGEEIYISWDDAVAGAVSRYEIVIEKYKRGDYGVHDIIRGSWMQSQGELMQIFGDVSAAGRYLREGIKEELVEAKEKIDSRIDFVKTEAVEKINSVKSDATDAVDSIMSIFDRYL